MRKAYLKHLTLKTVFLSALGSGKRRSEIHAWLYKNIRHQENWSQVSLYPCPSFLSKNQLAREGLASVAPVVIPVLAPSLDNSLKEDKSLCPVRALRYFLDRTKDLREGKDLVFVSFKKSFQKDILPSTISSWIKQTVLFCYQLSDPQGQMIPFPSVSFSVHIVYIVHTVYKKKKNFRYLGYLGCHDPKWTQGCFLDSAIFPVLLPH